MLSHFMAAPFFPITMAFCVGLFASRLVSSPLSDLLLANAALILLMWGLHFKVRGSLFSLAALTVFAFLGMTWARASEAFVAPNHLRSLLRAGMLDLSLPCRVTGVCVSSAIHKGAGDQIELKVSRIENGFAFFQVQGKMRLAIFPRHDTASLQKPNLPQEDPTTSEPSGNLAAGPTSSFRPIVAVGDEIEVLATLKRPKNFQDPGQFDYVSYLERQGIYLVGSIKSELLVTKIAAQRGSWLTRAIQKVRSSLLRKLDSMNQYPEQVRASLKALLLGDKQELSPKVETDFQATGLYHILVISGQHVAIMAAFLLWIMRLARLPLVLRLPPTALGLIAYCLVTEGQSSIIRATLMVLVFLAAWVFDRGRSVLNSLSLAAMSLLTLDPRWLLDPGFQLSFLAVLAIALIGLPLVAATTLPYRRALRNLGEPSLDAHFAPSVADFRVALRLKIDALENRIRRPFKKLANLLAVTPFRLLLIVADGFLVSIGVQLLFFVLMILYFHRVSLISVFLNLLALPLVGLIIPTGFLYLLLAPVPWLGGALLWFSAFLTRMLLQLASWFSNPAWGNYRVPSPPAWVVVLYLACLGAFLALPSRHKWLRRVTLGGAGFALLLLLIQPFPLRHCGGSLEATFLDVRQGDSTFLVFPDSATMLVDGGGLASQGLGEDFSEDRFDVGERVVAPVLWSKGVKTLDAVILTHAHHDHLAGLNSVFDSFEVKELWVGNNPVTPEYYRLLCKAIRKAVRVRTFAAGDELAFHGAEIHFLSPPRDYRVGIQPANNDSLAFRLCYDRRSFLLTGDIEKKIETRILDCDATLRSDVLKVSHQGSRSSSSPGFLDGVLPAVAVISVGESSPFGHPHPEVLQRLFERNVQVYRTDKDGAVTIQTDGRQLRVSRFVD